VEFAEDAKFDTRNDMEKMEPKRLPDV